MAAATPNTTLSIGSLPSGSRRTSSRSCRSVIVHPVRRACRRRRRDGGAGPERDRAGSAEPGVDLVLVLADPLRGGVRGLHAVLGDVLGHDVLVVVGPLEGLDQVDR